ncbi:MAG: hypothetical protein HY646_20910 [Acidobacteria bacterium]|nr:hypothetical protein [Acidobacteriota bacterium]
MAKDTEIRIDRSLQAIRSHIQRLARTLESDRVILSAAHLEIDAMLEDLHKQITLIRELRNNNRLQAAG